VDSRRSSGDMYRLNVMLEQLLNLVNSPTLSTE